jgi:hypothetical protein
MTTDQEFRDEELGSALRSLPVPEHREGFEETLLRGLRQPKARRPRTARWVGGFAGAAAVVAVVVAVVVGSLPGTQPHVASASVVRAAVGEAWASAANVGGVLVVESIDNGSGQPSTQRWRFLVTSDGDFRLTDLTHGAEQVYEASTNVERMLSVSESAGGDELFASERTGVAPGPPDQGPSMWILDRNLASVVRALAAGDGGTVEEVTYQGRAAWLLDTAIRPNLIVPEYSPDHLVATIDRETGFPLRVVATRNGEFVYEVSLEDLVVDGEVSADAFHLEFPPDTEVFRTDEGFRRVSLDEAAAMVGYQPVVPSIVPEGYELDAVFASLEPSITGVEGGNPAVGDIVSLSYRRGLDSLVVTTRPVGDDPSLWTDPMATGEGFDDRGVREEVTFSAGILSGRTGELLVDPLSIPHLWAKTDDLVVTIAGDLTRDELLTIADALQHGSP